MLKELFITFSICLVHIQSKHLAKVNFVQTGPSFRGSVHVNGRQFDLNLKAAEGSVFSSDFKLIVPDETKSGEAFFRDVTPSRQELYDLERNVYTDRDSNAALKIHHEQGEIRVHGVLENMHISHDGRSHFAIIHENIGANDRRARDFVYPPGYRSGQDEEISTRQASFRAFFVELHYVVDNAMWISLNRSNSAVANYLQLTTRAVNNRYATTTDPLMTIVVTGATAMNEKRYESSFMDNNACNITQGNESWYDMQCTLDYFSEYMYTYRNKTNKNFDVSALISGADWKTKDSNGRWSSDTAGLAWVKAACYSDGKKFLGTSVNADKDAIYSEVMVLVHELAHNLGAPHDGSGDSKSCPWSDGYIMSYEGWGSVNKLYFSNCTKSLMKSYANSAQGSCLRTSPSLSSWSVATKDLGDIYNMSQQCKLFLGRKDAIVHPTSTGDELCRNLKCNYNDACSSDKTQTCNWWVELNVPAHDNSVCNTTNNKKCYNGDCVVRP